MKKSKKEHKISWRRDDLERRFGFEGGKYLKVSAVPTCLLGAICSVAFYIVLFYLPDSAFGCSQKRGWTQHAVVFLGFWTFFLLWFKTRKIQAQRKPLALPILPDDPDFVLTVRSVGTITEQIRKNAESKDFILYRRIIQTRFQLAQYRSGGGRRRALQVPSGTGRKRARYELSRSSPGSSGIPILGFIRNRYRSFCGDRQFHERFRLGRGYFELAPALKDVTSGLATFETTLVALTVARSSLFATFVRKSEEELLDEISDFCTVNIVSKIRVEGNVRIASGENETSNETS